MLLLLGIGITVAVQGLLQSECLYPPKSCVRILTPNVMELGHRGRALSSGMESVSL
jgi:hypothetical protein